MTTPRRRWFRFRLRTWFVVFTAMVCGVGSLIYCRAWAEKRHRLAIQGGSIIGGSGDVAVPVPLPLFGEGGFERIRIKFNGDPAEDELTDEQRKILTEVRRTYSEAEVELVPRSPGIRRE